jgi:formiminoglutamase
MKIITVPFSGGGLGHGDGSNEAPKKIIANFENLFSNERGQEPKFKIDNYLDDKLDEKNLNKSHQIIQEYAEKQKGKVVFIGGDHSITHPLVKGYKKSLDEQNPEGELLFIVFDAHPDLMDDFRPPTQEDYLRVLLAEKILKPENVVLIGLRNWDKEELNFIKENKIKYFSMNDILKKGVVEISNELVKIINDHNKSYLSIDIDVVDPVEAIGTGYIEHGGMSSRELIYMVQEIAKTKKICAVDVVEVNPKKDFKEMTSKLASKLIFELGDF